MCEEERISNGELREWVYSAPSQIHGTGLFAATDIKKGTYIGTYHGPDARRNGMYVLWVVDPEDPNEWLARSGRNLLRYINHSESPNCEFDEFDLFALDDVRKGDELTFDYGEEFFIDD